MNVLHSTTKKHLLSTGVLATLVCALAFGGIQTVGAETTVSAGAEGSVQVKPKLVPRKETQAAVKDIRTGAQTVRKDIRQIATSTRQTVIQNGKDMAQGIRVDAKAGVMSRASTTKALRDNRASTTEALKANRASTTAALKANREAMIKDIQARRDVLKKQIDAKKGEKKQKLDAKKKVIVEGALQNIFRKLLEKVSKLVSIDNRLNGKIAELRAQGIDTTTATSLLFTAKASLEKAQIDVEATRALASEQASTSTTKEILKSLINTAETSIKSSADAYKKVGENLRPYLEGSMNASVNASVSASSSASN